MNQPKRYAVEHFSEITPVPCPCGMSRRAFVESSGGAATFHIVEIKKDAQLHYHKNHFEMYLILEGEGVMELDGDKVPVKQGSTVYIPAGCRHRALGQLKVANVSVPAFDPADEYFD